MGATISVNLNKQQKLEKLRIVKLQLGTRNNISSDEAGGTNSMKVSEGMKAKKKRINIKETRTLKSF